MTFSKAYDKADDIKVVESPSILPKRYARIIEKKIARQGYYLYLDNESGSVGSPGAPSAKRILFISPEKAESLGYVPKDN